MDKKVLITNSQGQQIQADVVMAFKIKNSDSKYNNNKYIVYTFNERSNESIKTYVSKIREENDEIYFDTITDEEEWKMVREAIMNQATN